MSIKHTLYRGLLGGMSPFIAGSRRLAPPNRPLLAILNRHGVLRGAVLRNDCSYALGQADASATFRAASLTKMVTALGALKCAEEFGLLLDKPLSAYTPFPTRDASLRRLLSHTSGLLDGAAYQASQKDPVLLDTLLRNPDMWGKPGVFMYSNLGYGLIGSMIEYVSGQALETWMQARVFAPLGLHCTYDITAVNPLNSYRLIPPAKAFDAKKRRQNAVSLSSPHPQAHYFLASGNLFTTARDMQRILKLMANGAEGFLSGETIKLMKTPHATYGTLSPTLSYGLGLLIVNDTRLSHQTLYGHQGFAYGSVNGAFFTEDGKQTLVSLNNGASEAREGRLGCLNRDLMRWAFQGGE